MSDWLKFVFRVLNKAGDAFIEPRREDGHGSAADKRSFVQDQHTQPLTDGQLAARGLATSAKQLPDGHGVTVLNPTADPETGLAKELTQQTVATRLLNIYNTLQGQREIAETLWTDDSGAFYARRVTVDESATPPTQVVIYTNPAGATVTPDFNTLRPIAGPDKETTQALFVATAAGTGYGVEDILARILILDTSTTPPGVTALWVNLSTGLLIAAPTPGTYEDAGELVGIKGANGTSIASPGNRLPVATELLPTLGEPGDLDTADTHTGILKRLRTIFTSVWDSPNNRLRVLPVGNKTPSDTYANPDDHEGTWSLGGVWNLATSQWKRIRGYANGILRTAAESAPLTMGTPLRGVATTASTTAFAAGAAGDQSTVITVYVHPKTITGVTQNIGMHINFTGAATTAMGYLSPGMPLTVAMKPDQALTVIRAAAALADVEYSIFFGTQAP